MQSRYPRHAQTFQVSSNAQLEEIIGQCNTDSTLPSGGFPKRLLRVSASTVPVFLGENNVACSVLEKSVCILIKTTYLIILKVRKGGRKHEAARGRKVLFRALGGFIPFGFFYSEWILPEPRVQSGGKRAVPPACAVPHIMWDCECQNRYFPK